MAETTNPATTATTPPEAPPQGAARASGDNGTNGNPRGGAASATASTTASAAATAGNGSPTPPAGSSAPSAPPRGGDDGGGNVGGSGGTGNGSPAPTPPAEVMPAWAVELQRRIEELRARQGALEAQRTAEARRAQVAEVLAPLPDEFRAGYLRMPVDGMSEAEWGEQLEVLRGEVSDLVASITRYGYQITPPQGGAHGEGTPGEASEAELALALARAGIAPKKKE